MAFQVSPGVQVQEIDLTNVVPAVSTSIGAYAGNFAWGPVEEITLIGSEKELANTFGTPNDATARSFFTAASFLKYGNSLKVVRAVGTGALNATVSGGGLLVKNRTAYDSVTKTGKGTWAAKCPGTLGNSIAVSICVANGEFSTWDYKGYFSDEPGTSPFAEGAGTPEEHSTNDEIHIVVIDSDGKWTGAAGTVLETFSFVSMAADARKPEGGSNYYANVINESSKYLWFLDAPAGLPSSGESVYSFIDFTSATGTTAGVIDEELTSGTDVDPTSGNVVTGLDLFLDPEVVDINLIFSAGDADEESTIADELISIAESRKDCLAFISPPLETTVGTTNPGNYVRSWADDVASTSYAVIDSTAVKVYDKYNDVYRWIPACGHIAGLCANTDRVADSWYSPAGLSRGTLLGVTKLAFNPNKAERDELFKKRINPIVSFPGQGILLYGDKTALAKPSAFDAINVRRLFITLEKAIATSAKAQLFEFNDEFTRAAFRNAVEPFLREVQGRRGLTDFKVVCDETNNTGDVIDRNEFVADIYIKPARSIRAITLSFIATRTGVQFSELVGA